MEIIGQAVADTAAEVVASVQMMDAKLRDMERAFWSVVAASGGRVCVPISLLHRFENPKWEIERDDANWQIIYRVTV